MSPAWLSVHLFLATSLVVALTFVIAGQLLSVKARVHAPLKAETYECGEPPAGPTWMQFHARYYVVALLFVLFDVEAALLFPWATQIRALGWSVAAPGLVFLGVVMLGWLYAVKKGALEWR